MPPLHVSVLWKRSFLTGKNWLKPVPLTAVFFQIYPWWLKSITMPRMEIKLCPWGYFTVHWVWPQSVGVCCTLHPGMLCPSISRLRYLYRGCNVGTYPHILTCWDRHWQELGRAGAWTTWRHTPGTGLQAPPCSLSTEVGSLLLSTCCFSDSCQSMPGLRSTRFLFLKHIRTMLILSPHMF